MTEINNLPDQDFQFIRDELKIPRWFPAAVVDEAQAAASRDVRSPELAVGYTDLLMVPFVTIDPPGSRDLDQAFYAARRGEGYLVRYAIADVGFFVVRGGAIEHEAWQRGETFYSPDIKTPLYPPMLSEGGASLLPDVPRPAVVFTFKLDARAETESFSVTRAVVRSRVQLAYPKVSLHLARERQQPGDGSLAGQEWSGSLTLLEEIGRKRQQLEAERGGVSLRIPSQQVQRWSTAVTGYRLAFETASDVEEWNAQISLMTGIAAAQMMVNHGLGLLRSLAPPRPDRICSLRLTAKALGVGWPSEMDYDDFVRSLDPYNPAHAVMLHQAARVTGGARYVAFDEEAPPHSLHAGVAASYAHVTAPLRRLADRYVLDLLVVLFDGERPSPELVMALQQLPQVMAESNNVAHRLESAIVDSVEARLMQDRVGEVFDALVIALRSDGVVIQITDPPIRTLLPVTVFAPDDEAGGKAHPILSGDGTSLNIAGEQILLGQPLALRLDMADPSIRRLSFSVRRVESRT